MQLGGTWGAGYQYKGSDGRDGSDADVTFTNIKAALQKAASTQQTFITADEVGAPNIYGGNIYGSHIVGGDITSDTTINVRTNASIGKKLIINADDFDNGVIFHHKDGSTVAEVYVDPATENLYLHSKGGNVIINGEVWSPHAIYI